MKHVISRSLAVFIVILALTVALPLLSIRLAGATKTLPVGYCVAGGSDTGAERLCDAFSRYGFEQYDGDIQLRSEVGSGRLSMGIIVPDDFSARLSKGDLEGIFTMLVSQSSALEVLQQTELTSALFEVYAPYVTQDALQSSGFEFEESAVFDRYYSMLDDELLFRFEQLSVEGKPIESVSIQNVFRLVLGLMLWIGALLGVCIPLTARVAALTPAIGRKKAWIHIGLPAFVLGFVMLAIFAVIPCIISGYTSVILPAIASLAVMSVIGMVLCIAFPGGHVCSLVCVFLAAFAPALCPSLTDISLIIPIIGKVRMICPVYWLWLFK